jgi:serine/threonine-protein kinase
MSNEAQPRAGLPAPGQVVAGKYQIQSVIGKGGMGVVVAAKHLELGQSVAIKFLDIRLASHPGAAARFFREARAATRIRSEHVTRVLDVARLDDGTPYLVMEHLTGTDLDRILRTRGPLPVDEVIDYILQACEALAEAHAAGVVHRDLKPGNLFLTTHADGTPLVKVLDFGISKFVEPDAPHDGAQTTATEMLGSPWYMSPEQVRSSATVDARTDVWSLGVIIHQLLTGAQAFGADTLSACLARIVMDAPPGVRTARPDVPEGLERVILACLEKNPDHRLQSVSELALALSPFAPERSKISIQRITRVLGGTNPGGSHTLPLASFAAAPGAAPPERGAYPTPGPITGSGLRAAVLTGAITGGAITGGAAPASGALTGGAPPGAVSTAASVSSTAASAPAKPRSVFPVVIGLAIVAGIGLAVAAQRYLAAPPVATAATASATATASAAPEPSAAPSAAPEPSAAPTASAATSAAPTASAATSAAPEVPAPKAAGAPPKGPAAPKTKPGKSKVKGPVETTL